MIKVCHKTNFISISGHAGSAAKGKDLICAAISSIVFGAINWFNQEDIKLLRDDCCGKIEIEIVKNKKDNNNLLTLMMIQILTVQQSFPKNVKITETILKGVTHE